MEARATASAVEAPHLQRFLLNVRPTGRYIPTPTDQLDDGSSKVDELETREDELICVGKKVHMRESNGGVNACEKVVEECLLMFGLRHPNVIQYLGLCVQPDSGGLLMAVMEYLPHCLQQLLRIVVDIPLPVKRSVLVDVARGVSYLHSHSPKIVHGKLTPTNILLTSSMTAKISDVGDMLHTDPPFLQGCPYLPPEAAQAPCTTATDIFSFGKLLLYTILQELPENTSSLLADASFPKLPVQQQTQAIEQVSQLPRDEGHTHPVERLVDWCLQKEAGNRPAASQVLDVLTKGWAEVECPYEQITKMKLAVTTKLLEQSLINQFQDAASANQVDTQNEVGSRATGGLGKQGTVVMEDEGLEGDDIDVLQSGLWTTEDETEVTFDEDMGASGSSTENAVPSPSPEAAAPQMDTPDVDIHMVQVDVVADGSKKKLYQCKFCEASFARSSSLKRHTQNHTGEKPFQCTMCPAGFSNPSGLKRHTLTHTGEKPFKCKRCDAKFTQSHHLKEHTRIHVGEKPFQCKTCDARFTSSSDLKRHTLTHTGEKPYQCKVCHSTFRQSIHLKEHLRSHTGGKPFQCDVCETRFTRSSHLKRHQLTHTGEKPLQCQVCGSKFARANSLKRHLLTHTKQRPTHVREGTRLDFSNPPTSNISQPLSTPWI